MRRSLYLVAFFATLTAALSLTVPIAGAGGSARHIVVLKDSANPDATARDHARSYGAEVSHVYRSALKGYAAVIPASRIDDVRNDARVDYLSADRAVSIAAQTLPTGINRIDGELSSTVSATARGR